MEKDNKVIIAKQKNKYIKVTFDDMTRKLGGLGICDRCNDSAIVSASKGTANLIPVLNMVFCDECFEKWENEAEYFPEDEKYENEKTSEYLERLQDRKKVIK